jgi:hypothetical protein
MPENPRPAVELSVHFGDTLLAVVPLTIPGREAPDEPARIELRLHGDPESGAGHHHTARVRLGPALVSARRDPAGSLTTYTYDAAGRPWLTSPFGRITTAVYDAAGNLLDWIEGEAAEKPPEEPPPDEPDFVG